MTEWFVLLNLTTGHLTTVKSYAGEGFGHEGHDGVILSSMPVSAWDKGYEGSSALVVVVEVAAFVFDLGVGGVKGHSCFVGYDETKESGDAGEEGVHISSSG